MRYRYNRNPEGLVLLCALIFVPVAALLLIVAAFFLTPIVADTTADNFVVIYEAFAILASIGLVLYIITEIEKDHKHNHPRNRVSHR